MNILRALGRPFLALPFVLSGVEALARPAGHRERAEMMAPLANTLGVPLEERHYDMATRALGATTAVAGLALAFGKAPRFAALALAGVQVPIMVRTILSGVIAAKNAGKPWPVWWAAWGCSAV